MTRGRFSTGWLAVLASLACSPASAVAAPLRSPQSPIPIGTPPLRLVAASCPRIADAKLVDGAVRVSYWLAPAGAKATSSVDLFDGATLVTNLWSGQERALTTPVVHTWDGRMTGGGWVRPGRYTVRVQVTPSAGGPPQTITYPLDLVRLGITEIAAQGPKWQLVYFKKGSLFRFFATPALHEYYCVADTGDVADMDRNDGSPRPAPAIHTGLASPPLEANGNYEDDSYNFPICCLAGGSAKLQVRFGTTGSDGLGAAQWAGYPLPGVMLRCRATSNGTPWLTPPAIATPGGTATFSGPTLPAAVGRTDVAVTWTFDASDDGGANWQPVPGHIDTQHRFYTILDMPRWATGATGLQYAGPWVEVLEDIQLWKTALGIDTSTSAGVVEALIKGFSGQIGPLTTAIEGVVYDTSVLGGDSGSSHYYQGFPPVNTVLLSRLLDNHANGVFVNCSDCASCTAGMLGMVGVANLQLQRLGNMSLRAIRGIGAPAYTLSLWGPSTSHAFSYHHIITRNNGVNVSDACLWVDEDGNPNALPGTPGYNVDRPWSGSQAGYEALVAFGTVGFFFDPLPRVN